MKKLIIILIMTLVSLDINYRNTLNKEDVRVVQDSSLAVDKLIDSTTNSSFSVPFYSGDEDNIVSENKSNSKVIEDNNEVRNNNIEEKIEKENKVEDDKKENNVVEDSKENKQVIEENVSKNDEEEDKLEAYPELKSELEDKNTIPSSEKFVGKKENSEAKEPSKNDKNKIPSNRFQISDNKETKTVTIIDKSEGQYFAQVIEYFYEDAYYKYYFTCQKSQYIYVVKNNQEYKLVYALNNNIVTMAELEENGYHFLKESKNLAVK